MTLALLLLLVLTACPRAGRRHEAPPVATVCELLRSTPTDALASELAPLNLAEVSVGTGAVPSVDFSLVPPRERAALDALWGPSTVLENTHSLGPRDVSWEITSPDCRVIGSSDGTHIRNITVVSTR